MESYKMYEIDTSSFFAYIGTILRLVGGALSLDPAAFQTAYNQVDVSGIFLWIVLIGGLSLMFGQSVVLFANRVKPGRFVISLFLGAIKFFLDVLVVLFVTWSIINLRSEEAWDFGQVGRAIALAAAPYWLGVFILVPFLGLLWERLLKVYVFIAIIVAVQTIFGLPFLRALSGAAVVWLVSYFITLGFGRLFTPITDRIAQSVTGGLEFSSTRQIYEMFARHDQITR
jgi:hypothetical protein